MSRIPSDYLTLLDEVLKKCHVLYEWPFVLGAVQNYNFMYKLFYLHFFPP